MCKSFSVANWILRCDSCFCRVHLPAQPSFLHNRPEGNYRQWRFLERFWLDQMEGHSVNIEATRAKWRIFAYKGQQFPRSSRQTQRFTPPVVSDAGMALHPLWVWADFFDSLV